MNSNRFTQNSIQAINSCERIAEEYGNTEIMPVHILYALMEKDGLIPRILSRSGTDCDGLTAAAKEEIEKLPRSSSRGNVFLSPAANRIFNNSEKLAQSMKDDYISVEHIFMSILDENDPACERIFKRFGITKNGFLQGLKAVRGNTNVKTDNPEDTYDALEKYGGEQNRQLLEQIDALLAERNALTEEYAAAENEPYKTGNAALDTVLRYIANRAANSGAAFEVKCGEGAFGSPAKDEKFLSDCCSVLCDLGENAACAVKKGGKICAELGTSYGAPYISVCDDAPPFDLNVLKLMGKRRVTTRKAEGGSGIGLMAVAAIADKHRASFVFEEHTKDRYFKRLRITFDGADKKRVITDREESAAIFSAREGFTVELLK